MTYLKNEYRILFIVYGLRGFVGIETPMNLDRTFDFKKILKKYINLVKLI